MKKLFYSLFFVALMSLNSLFTLNAVAEAQTCWDGTEWQCDGSMARQGYGRGQHHRMNANQQAQMNVNSQPRYNMMNNVDTNADQNVFRGPGFMQQGYKYNHSEFLTNCLRMNDPNYLMQGQP